MNFQRQSDKVLAIDWHVRGLCRCLCLTHVVCAWVRVQPFQGVITSLQTQGAKYRSSGFIPTNKQTHKQTKFKHTSILLTTIPATKQPRHLKCGTRSSECDEIPAYKHTSSLPSMQHTSIQQSNTAPIPSLSPSPHHCTIHMYFTMWTPAEVMTPQSHSVYDFT